MSDIYYCLIVHFKIENVAVIWIKIYSNSWTNFIVESSSVYEISLWRQDTQNNDIQHNDTQHNDAQHNDTQHNGTQNNDIQQA